MHYIILQNGQVFGPPRPISTDQSESPNIYWESAQMALHNFVAVDISYDPTVESLDLDNPVISDGNKVTYTKTTLSLTVVKANKIKAIKNATSAIIRALYSYEVLMDLASGQLVDEEASQTIQAYLDSQNDRIVEVNATSTVEDCNAISSLAFKKTYTRSTDISSDSTVTEG